MSSDAIIQVENLSKCYQIYENPRDRLKQFILPKLQRITGQTSKNYFREFWALRDISFSVERGETVGIIGRNGSGKSTLLQMICGTLNPTQGSIETKGRIAALLELGSGFNPEFSGRENVYMNAALLGLNKTQINERFNDIAAFAEIGSYMDQPVKRYSSGMYVRLAFAVIAHIDADILIVDEALSVGDVFFQQKCMRFLRQFREAGGSLLFVSHDTPAVMALCNQAILIGKDSDGKHFIHHGQAEEVCKIYLRELYSDPSRAHFIEAQSADIAPQCKNLITLDKATGKMSQKCRYIISSFNANVDWFGERGGVILHAQFQDMEGCLSSVLEGDQRTTLVVRVKALKLLRWPAIGIIFKDRQGQSVFTESTDPHFREIDLTMHPGDIREVQFTFKMPCLIRGNYTLDIAYANGVGDDHIQQHWLHDPIHIECIEGRHVHGIAGLSDLEIFWKH